jgi:fructose-specific phosphotransferase system IIC component
MPVLVIPPLWLAHVAGSYTAASLRCHDVALGGSDSPRIAMGALTLAMAAALVAIGMALRRRTLSSAEDARLAGFVGSILAGLFAAYLIWSVLPIVAPESCP